MNCRVCSAGGWSAGFSLLQSRSAVSQSWQSHRVRLKPALQLSVMLRSFLGSVLLNLSSRAAPKNRAHRKAGGFRAISRWLSEARATPPVSKRKMIRTPEGCQQVRLPGESSAPETSAAATPAGVEPVASPSRWYRSLWLPRPPANRCQASGLKKRSGRPFSFTSIAITP